MATNKPELKVVPADQSEDNTAHFFVDGKEVTSDEYNKAANPPEPSAAKVDIAERSQELNDILHNEYASVTERSEARAELNRLSKQAGKDFAEKLAKNKDLDTKEKQILTFYNEGVQNFEIARRVFDGMVNSDTVGKVVLTIRKQHAEDFDEIEDINSTRGYTGVSGGSSGKII